MEGEALMAVEPGPHLEVLVSAIVVEDDVDGLAGRHCVDGVEKADELLMAVALHVPADDGAVEDVEGGEQRGPAVALVIVGHGAEPSLLQGQAGLGPVERLNLALRPWARQREGSPTAGARYRAFPNYGFVFCTWHVTWFICLRSQIRSVLLQMFCPQYPGLTIMFGSGH